MRRYVVFASLLACAAAGPAFADGAFRAEGRVGYEAVTLTIDYDDGVNQVTYDDNEYGLTYGGEVGYDIDLGGQFVGPYAALDFGDAKYCVTMTINDEGCLKVTRNIAFGVRAGIGAADGLRGYVKLGYVNSAVKASYVDFDDASNNTSGSEDRSGYQFGVGLEYPFGQVAYGKIEYLYSDYADFAIDAVTRGDFSRHQGVAGVGVRF